MSPNSFLSRKGLKLKFNSGFFGVFGVAMVDTKMIKTCLPIIGMFFDTIIVASTDKEWLSPPIKLESAVSCCQTP